jgi:hypothetical protein
MSRLVMEAGVFDCIPERDLEFPPRTVDVSKLGPTSHHTSQRTRKISYAGCLCLWDGQRGGTLRDLHAVRQEVRVA